tara:strand:+ start:516 stop:995 length:480 start_codon:yes stop_codon:yes gene_type:complete
MVQYKTVCKKVPIVPKKSKQNRPKQQGDTKKNRPVAPPKAQGPSMMNTLGTGLAAAATAAAAASAKPPPKKSYFPSFGSKPQTNTEKFAKTALGMSPRDTNNAFAAVRKGLETGSATKAKNSLTLGNRYRLGKVMMGMRGGKKTQKRKTQKRKTQKNKK